MPDYNIFTVAELREVGALVHEQLNEYRAENNKASLTLDDNIYSICLEHSYY